MIRIANLPLPVGGDMEQLKKRVARVLGVRPGMVGELEVVRQSIDARNRHDVHYVYTIEVAMPEEEQLVQLLNSRRVSLVQRTRYAFPEVTRRSSLRPVVVGMGPAGLFSALFLARNGLPCLVLERGQEVDKRVEAVEQFWKTGLLNPSSNVQFGEGGAGTFSDGKLTTGTHDPRIQAVMETLVEAGAPADVGYSHKPHIGSDQLRQVVKAIRRELEELGCEIQFGSQLVGLTPDGDRLGSITIEQGGVCRTQPCDTLILAPGHSARDTFAMLQGAGVPMQRKGFAIGLRIEHTQQAISRNQYGSAWEQLPPADYKLACHLPNGRSAFTFCVCPGGEVVAAASEDGGVAVNGMSLRARDGGNINGGFLVGIAPEDMPGEDVLAGVGFQRQWEQAAFALAGGGFLAPAQRVEDFLLRRPSQGAGSIQPTYRPGVTWTQLDPCLPGEVIDSLRLALPLMDQKLHGFAAPDAVLTGVETRSSSPVRIVRGENYQSALRGLYPCGEGAGYAGGIVSAAVDGIRVAEAVAR